MLSNPARESLYGHLAVKWSPLQILQTTFPAPAFERVAFNACCSDVSDSAAYPRTCQWNRYRPCKSHRTLFPGVSFRKTVSPTVVVALSGPGLLPFSSPNLAHVFRSATACSTNDFCRVRLILLVISSDYKNRQRAEAERPRRTLTFLPSSLTVYSTIVRIPFSSI